MHSNLLPPKWCSSWVVVNWSSLALSSLFLFFSLHRLLSIPLPAYCAHVLKHLLSLLIFHIPFSQLTSCCLLILPYLSALTRSDLGVRDLGESKRGCVRILYTTVRLRNLDVTKMSSCLDGTCGVPLTVSLFLLLSCVRVWL